MTDTSEQVTTQSSAKVLGGLVAYLQVDGALKAAKFYQRAFGAETVFPILPMSKAGRCTFTSTSTALR